MKKLSLLVMFFMLLFSSNVFAEDLTVKDVELDPAITASVGDKFNLNIYVIYDDEFTLHDANDPYYKRPVGLTKTDYTISDPHLLQVLNNGMVKILGVGSSKITVKVENIEKSVIISGSLDNPIDGGYLKNGVTLVPMKEVVQALGGSVNYLAQQGLFEIKVGSTQVSLPKSGTKASLNGNSLTLKSPLLVENGVTLMPASVLSDAFGAGLKNNGETMQVSVGQGKMDIQIEKPKKQSSTTVTKPTKKGKLYAVPATGDMKGWSILKGHPYEKSVIVYFKVDGSIVQIHTKDISKVDLNKKVKWTDLNGKKHTNTVKELYLFFGKTSGLYSSELLYKMFGETYANWIAIGSINAEQYVDQYLQK